MLFRINYENFLLHMIDYFPPDELEMFQYAVISFKVKFNSRVRNGNNINVLFPNTDIVNDYYEYENKDAMRRMYWEWLDRKECISPIYDIFILNMLNHKNVIIICQEIEDPFIDVLVEYLEDKFSIECADLNQLFKKGRMGSIYIDHSEIYNKTVDLRRKVGIEEIKNKETTESGRRELLQGMSMKDKVYKLKEIGFKVSKHDKSKLDRMLIDEWVDDDAYLALSIDKKR